MPRKTQQQRADELGITKAVLNNAKNQGVNIWNDAEMVEWMGNRRPRAGKKVGPGKAPVPTSSGDEVTVEQLEREVKAAGSYEEVRTIKEKIAALLQAQKVRKEEGNLIALKDAKEAVIQIVSGLKGRLLKVPSDTAPRVEGLNAAKAEKVIREEMIKALEDLENDGERIFQEA